MKMRAVSIVICIIILSGTFANVGAVGNIPDKYSKLAETENLILYYNYSKPSIILENKRNGFLWGSSVSESYYDMKGVNVLWKDNMNSLFNLYYTSDFRKMNVTNNLRPKTEVSTNIIDNGISLDFNFKDLNLSITLNIWLDKDSVNLSFPAERIKEEGKFAIATIELLPFFGAANDNENGYIFYPDGSGAVNNFKGKPNKMVEKYSWDIYGEDALDLDELEKMRDNGLQQAMLPVFGLKKGDNAFIAVVTGGEYDSIINLYPSGYAVNLNRICSEFVYRRIYKDTRPGFQLVTYIERDMNKQDHAIKYIILDGSQANYSGMASAYRSYLIESGGIQKVIKDGQPIPLWLDIFMGIKEKRILIDKFIKMTTFSQAKDIINAFKAKNVDDIEVNLIGWTKDGYGTFPIHWPPSRVLGGTTGLKKLAEYAETNHVKLFLEDNFVDAISESGGFSKRNDVVYHKTNISVTDKLKEAFLLNPVKVFKKYMEGFLPQAKDVAVAGLSFDRFGRFIYYDFHKDNPVTRGQTAEYWSKFLEESTNKIGSSVVRGGNAYVLKNTDRLLDIPMKDSGYLITDESIPFYQMVVHGLIPYSSEPGNLFYDFPRQKLKWVEYGYMPYFKLTYNKPVLLRKTKYNDLFTSYYVYWVDEAAETYNEFNKRLGSTWFQAIKEHKKISEGTYRITYEDNTKVYVNYNNNSVFADGYTVKAMDYLVIDGEGNQR